MKILVLLLSLLVGLCLVTPAAAQATRTWVSGVGDDANPCSRTAPCKTFAGAISKTATFGEINCLDPGGFGAVTITKSIIIDCSGTFGSILHSSTNGVIINFDAFAGGDTQKSVRLRGLSITGANTGLTGVRIIGGAAALGSEVFIENSVIDGQFAVPGRGIGDERTGGGELSVLNTTIRNTLGICVAVLTGTVRKDAIIDRVSLLNCNIGLFASNLSKVMVTNTTIALNTGAGIQLDPGAEMAIDRSVISNNGTGITNSATVRLANTDVTLNGVGFAGTTSVQSFGNNRVVGNTALGNGLTLIGAQSHDSGQN